MGKEKRTGYFKTPALGYPLADHLRSKFLYQPETGKVHHRSGPRGGREAFTSRSDGYMRGRVGDQLFCAHLVIWVMTYGWWPQERGLTIDHIDRDRSNNKLSNLRAVPQSENQRNKSAPKNNTSGIVGVYAYPKGKWTARIRVSGKHIVLGTFGCKREAVIARTSAEKALGFHPQGNKPREGLK